MLQGFYMNSVSRQASLIKVIDQIGYLMNSVEPAEEINKMVILEMSINPKAKDMSYNELLTEVIFKLVDFYKDPELEQLWVYYLVGAEEEDEAAGFADEEIEEVVED